MADAQTLRLEAIYNPGWKVRWWKATKKFARRKPVAFASGIFLIFMLVIGVAAPYISLYDPLSLVGERLQSPSWEFPFGTDNQGRDVLSRTMWGARTSMVTGLLVTTFAGTVGLLIGGISGYLGGWFDAILQRVLEAIIAVPFLAFAIVLVAVIGPWTPEQIPMVVVIALSIALIPGGARVARAAALSVTVEQYVDAAHSIGGSRLYIFRRHVIPNILSPMLVIVTLQLGGVILAEAGLSFLGLGTPPPTPSWGAMVNGSRTFIRDAPWMVLAPGLGLSLAVLAFNFLGDGIRDVADPRLRGS